MNADNLKTLATDAIDRWRHCSKRGTATNSSPFSMRWRGFIAIPGYVILNIES